MARPKVKEVDYFQFLEQLKLAGDAGRRIDPADKARWKAYVQSRGIQEAATMVFAKAKAEVVKSAIIDGGDWDGYYVYGPDDHLCLKYVPAD